MAPAYSANQCVQLFILSLAVLCSLVSSKVQLEKNMYVKTFIHKLQQDPYSELQFLKSLWGLGTEEE
jgi:hypothetical protein